MVDLIERIDVMLKQEARVYKTLDYLDPEYQQKLSLVSGDGISIPSTSTASVSSTSTSSSSTAINELWREKICEWSYQVIDHFDFSREIVGVSIHYLDRYLANTFVNKKTFQLAAMTCLFLAIKLYEPGKLSMSSMIELSRGYFTVDQMAAMETSILRSLSWHMHPPNALCFAKHILFLLPYKSIGMDTRHDILELARFLTELSVIDYFFVVYRPSVVAVAALLNSMEDTPGAVNAIGDFTRELKKVTTLSATSRDVVDCRKRLRLLYAQGGYSRPTASAGGSRDRDETISPVCVSYGCNVVPPEGDFETTP